MNFCWITLHVRFCFVQDPNGIEVQLVETK